MLFYINQSILCVSKYTLNWIKTSISLKHQPCFVCSRTTSGWWSPCQTAQSNPILISILDMRPPEDEGLLASYVRVGYDLVAPGGE